MANKTKINTEEVEMVELLSREDVEKEFGEAVASVNVTDQSVTWAKFTLTDDAPNENRQRVPFEEFDNILKTGQYKPVKMAMGEIKDGHDDAKPLGVITHVTKQIVEGGRNKIIALAALWNHERTDDVAMLKDRVNKNKPVNVSWEILYGNHRIKDGVEDLLDTILKAVTVVGVPAYAGRTQFLAVAATKWSPAYEEKLPDSSFLYTGNGERYFAYRDDTGKIDPTRFPVILENLDKTSLSDEILTGIKKQAMKLNFMIQSDASLKEILDVEDEISTEEIVDIKELEGKLAVSENKVAEAANALAALQSKYDTLVEEKKAADEKVTELTNELEPLKEFKTKADADVAKAAKIESVKAKFTEKGLEKDDEYFITNEEKLLGMDENALEFMLQEMAAFKAEGNTTVASKKTVVPNIPGNGGQTSIKDLVTALRERNKK